MKYRFLKDFPPTKYKAGDIFEEAVWIESSVALMLVVGVIEEVKEERLELKHNELYCAEGNCKYCLEKLYGKSVEPKWEPKEDEAYWYIEADDVCVEEWTNVGFDRNNRDFLGIYRTEVEALAARDYIKKCMKEYKK